MALVFHLRLFGLQTLEGNAWHADHIIPVYKGGGMCQLDNLRTLCVPCHQVLIWLHAAS